MTRSVFVIHSSDILRKGLVAILRSYFNLDVTQLLHVRELSSFTEIENTTIVVFSGFLEQHDRIHIEKLKTNNLVHHFCIQTASNDSSLPSGADETLFLDTSKEEIQTMVANALEKVSSTGTEKSLHGELTVREKEVLSLVGRGHSNKEIADKLFISVHTVISHRKNITEKLGIKSISGLTVYAILNKIIDPDQINTDELI